MHVIRHTNDIRPGDRNGALALGNFDGVHIGHQQVIGTAQKAAKDKGVPSGALIFEPHPQQFFFPDRPFFRLTPFRAKTRLLEALGIDFLAALPFDACMAERSAESFVEDILDRAQQSWCHAEDSQFSRFLHCYLRHRKRG